MATILKNGVDIPSHVRNVVVVLDHDYIDGGANKVAFAYARMYVEAGLNTFFFSGTHTANAPRIDGVHFISSHQIPSLQDKFIFRGLMNGLYNFKAKRVLKELLLKLNPKETIVHIHGWTKLLSSSIWNAAYELHIPIYLTNHDYFSVCPNGGLFNFKANKICHERPLSFKCLTCNCDSRNYGIKLYRCARFFVQTKIVDIYKKTSKFISISDFSENVLRQYLPKDASFERQYNPVDSLKINTSIDFTKNQYFLFVGRLTKNKGCDIFCQAVSDCNLKGIVVGDGPELKTLKNQFAESNIEFVGWKLRNEVFEYMKKARALVFPSRWYETDGLSVREALSIGLPCLVSGCCASSDYITDSSKGYVFNSLDELELNIKKYTKANKDV